MSQRVILDIDDETAEQITAVPTIDGLVQALNVRYRDPYANLMNQPTAKEVDLKALLVKLHYLIRIQLKPVWPLRQRQTALERLVAQHPEAGQLRFYGNNLTQMSREELMAIIAAQHKGEL